MNRATIAATAFAVLAAVTGCGTVPPAGSVTPSTGTPSPSASATPSASASSTASSTATPPATTSPATTPAAAKVVLNGTGVGGFAFDSPVATVEAALRQRLGTPTRAFEDSGCPMNPTWTRTLIWGNLRVFFTAQGTATKTAATTLRSWHLMPPRSLPAGAALGTGLPASPTVTQLKAAYPAATITSPWSGTWLIDLGNGVTYVSSTKTGKIESIIGGHVDLCD